MCGNNRLDDSTITAPESSPYVFTNALDLKNRNKLYKPGSKSFTIEIDTISNTSNMTFFSILGASNDVLRLSDSATVTVKANSINLFTGTVPFEKTATVGEIGVYLDLTDDDNPQGVSYRYWNIDIEDTYNPNDIEIAYIYLGDHVLISRNISNRFGYQVLDRSRRGTSDSGKIYSLKKPEQTLVNALSLELLKEEDKKKIISFGRKVGTHTP